jgi:hypothetical protein
MYTYICRDRGILIELFISGSGDNRHFHNLAHWYGRKYEGISVSNPIDINVLSRVVLKAISEIKLDLK